MNTIIIKLHSSISSSLDIKNHLETIAKKENILFDDESLYLIANKSDGALRDALSIFDCNKKS